MIKLFLFSIVCGCYLLFVSIWTFFYVMLMFPEVLKEWWQDFLRTYFYRENLIILVSVLVDIYLLISLFQKLPFLLFFAVFLIWTIVGWLLVED